MLFSISCGIILGDPISYPLQGEIMDLISLLASFDTALSFGERIKEIVGKTKNEELNSTISKLLKELIDLRKQHAKLTDELLAKDTEIKKLKQQNYFRENLFLDKEKHGYMFNCTPPKGYHEGPYCQNCFDDKEKLISLNVNKNGAISCPACKTKYKMGEAKIFSVGHSKMRLR